MKRCRKDLLKSLCVTSNRKILFRIKLRNAGSLIATTFRAQKFKLDAANGVALGISAVAAALANAAGVGGGGMFVPLFELLGFDTKTATALSQGQYKPFFSTNGY